MDVGELPPPEPTAYVLGVDPGTTALGWAIINPDTLELEQHGCYFIRRRSQLTGNDALLASDMWDFWVNIILASPYRPTRVIVEQNAMNRLYSNVEMLLLGFAVGCGMSVAAVHPLTWKKKIGVKATGKHYSNKQESLEYIRSLGYTVETDHEADAICMALCALMT